MLNRLSQDKYFYGLDLGARKIKACALKLTEEGITEIVGIFETDTHGFSDDSVSDLNELSENIYHVIEKLAEKTGVKAKELQLGVNGDLIFVRPTNTMIPLVDRGHKVISKKDIKKVNQHARLLGVKMEEEILHEVPMNYIVDDSSAAVNPLGLYGRTLGVEALLIGSKTNSLRNITKAVHQAGFDVDHISFSSLAASNEILTEEQKVQGVALVDIGSKVTSLLIFKDKVLKHVDVIHIGGDHFTERISDEINLPFNLAEEIKKSYALAVASPKQYDEEILVKKESSYIPVKRETICQAIQSCVSHLVGSINESLKVSGYYHHINQGVVMTGGGGLMPGLIECIGEKTNMPVHLGKILLAPHRNVGNAALFAAVVGLAHNGYKKSIRKRTNVNDQPGHWSKTLINRVVELYNEYF